MERLGFQETEALEAFKRSHGRCWKQALCEAWMTGNYASDDDAQVLQYLRNASYFGPRGLIKYRSTK